jgi:hypothetical protein
MGRKQRNTIRETVTERESLRDAELLCTPADHVDALTILRSAVRLLLISRSSLERQIVGFHLYHGMPLEQLADRLNQPRQRISDLWLSMGARLAVAEEAAARKAKLERLTHEKTK